MRPVEELRSLTVQRLLDIRQRTAGEDWEPEERALRRNAEVLAECCFAEGARAYADSGEVLAELTVGEMERLLLSLARDEGRISPERKGENNAAFDERRFQRLRQA